MDYQVALSASARRDLQDIVRYISLDQPSRALAFGQFLIAKTRALAQFPEMGRVVPELEQPEIREIIVRSYRVISFTGWTPLRAASTSSASGMPHAARRN